MDTTLTFAPIAQAARTCLQWFSFSGFILESQGPL